MPTNKAIRTADEDLAEISKRIEYIPETGHFYWRISPKGGIEVGDVAGWGAYKAGGLYKIWVLKINCRTYKAHRVAWLFSHGEWPSAPLDHINGDGWDNRITNLRLASYRLNAENRHRSAFSNPSGYLGVSADRGRWRARIKSEGKYLSLGTFCTPEEAYAMYLSFKRRLHEGNTL